MKSQRKEAANVCEDIGGIRAIRGQIPFEFRISFDFRGFEFRVSLVLTFALYTVRPRYIFKNISHGSNRQTFRVHVD